MNNRNPLVLALAAVGALVLLAIGVVVFDERPNWLVLLGAGLIVASGLYTMWRERKVGGSA